MAVNDDLPFEEFDLIGFQQNPDGPNGEGDGGVVVSPMMNFFVTSKATANGNLGGLAGADTICNNAVNGTGWLAYLSTTSTGAGTTTVNAQDRIGAGPYYNAVGAMVAADKMTLLMNGIKGAMILDELGSPTPTGEPAVWTGTRASGNAGGANCSNWTSMMKVMSAVVGDSHAPNPLAWQTGKQVRCDSPVVHLYCFKK
jgi:hypothetical protein